RPDLGSDAAGIGNDEHSYAGRAGDVASSNWHRAFVGLEAGPTVRTGRPCRADSGPGSFHANASSSAVADRGAVAAQQCPDPGCARLVGNKRPILAAASIGPRLDWYSCTH